MRKCRFLPGHRGSGRIPRTGRALGNPVPRTEDWVTMIDGILAAAVVASLVLNADPAAAYVLGP
jgi:hypothetical protein